MQVIWIYFDEGFEVENILIGEGCFSKCGFVEGQFWGNLQHREDGESVGIGNFKERIQGIGWWLFNKVEWPWIFCIKLGG